LLSLLLLLPLLLSLLSSAGVVVVVVVVEWSLRTELNQGFVVMVGGVGADVPGCGFEAVGAWVLLWVLLWALCSRDKMWVWV
jgi:hypothetical protein